MACLNMYNNEPQQQPYNNSISTPRISFSNDFADPQHMIKHESSYREPPVSSDFQFSVSNYDMISADEVFFKGKLLPVNKNIVTKVTLRDELRIDDVYENSVPRIPKSSSRWKERLGLKRAHIVPKKSHDFFLHEHRSKLMKEVENCASD